MDSNMNMGHALFARDGAPPMVIDYRVPEYTFMAVAWSATAISLLFIVFRLATRLRSFSRLYPDDYLVVLAWFMLLASTIVWQVKSYVLYWQYDVANGRVAPSLEFLKAYESFICHVVTWNVLFYSCLWTIKASFLIFFRRLDSKVTGWRNWAWWIICGICVAGYIACIADIDYKCSVNNIQTILAECPKPDRTAFQLATFYANMAADVFTDLLIIAIPITILWNIKITLRKKLILFAIFSLTIFVILVAVIRVVLVFGDKNTAVRYANIEWLYLWSNVEMGIALTVACLASFRQLFVQSKKQINSPWSFGQNGTSKARSLMYLLRSSRKDTTINSASLSAKSANDIESQTELTHIPTHSVHVKHTINVDSSDANYYAGPGEMKHNTNKW